MLKGRRIALIEDDEIMGASLLQRLQLEGAEVLWLKLAQRAIGALRTPRAPIDAVVCDIRLPDGSGEEVFATLCRSITPPPFLFITGQGEIDQAVRLLQAGAADYLTKPFGMPVFLDRLSALLRAAPLARLPMLLGPSPAARRVEDLALTAAAHDRPVLIRGGAGTGKALVARRIHAASDRRAAPFVHVNLAREADASAALEAALAEVGDGVLFLNALERLGALEQARLMGWLDTGAARIIAACGADMADLVGSGAFRGDLYARLNPFEIPIPPLRDRPDDAVWLLHQQFATLNPRRSPPLRGITALADQAVAGHDWPGGGRELRARLVQALATAQGDWLFPADLFPERQTDPADTGLLSLAEARDAAERAQIIAALERTGGQVAEAAKLLRISRTTLWEKMQKLGL
ncbi:sigma-54-dependent transcriptional regulator [Rhodobacter ferrooxidans]|uniref:Two component, sigma54 specific, transcriptional regulator, Fis family n=1 Tax=Rhodobacter ferrooxidans TaxID=371731 RepID=C8RWG4_9RHOB|nr:sigma 54-interacting transcriptional regulator [Rhodobacter sp. SW2]EEW26907.1 two component, sigma54 specific, transcriptional regulator, Fis family [Rhodobacter sp. SW2]